MRKRSERNTTILLLLLGAIALGIGIYLFIGKQEFVARSIVTDGVVSELESSYSSKGGRIYYPVIEYKDAAGQQQFFRSQIGSSPASYDVGEPVKVRYESGKPSTASIEGFWEMWGGLTIAGGIGLLFLGIGVGNIYSAIHLERRRKELPKTGRMVELPGRAEIVRSKSKTEFFIRTEWLNPEDQKLYIFDSEKFYFDPTPFLINRLVHVWIDPQNPKKRYYVDVSFLPVEA